MNRLIRSAAAIAAAIVVSFIASLAAVAGPAQAASGVRNDRAVASEVLITSLMPPRIQGRAAVTVTPARANISATATKVVVARNRFVLKAHFTGAPVRGVRRIEQTFATC